MKIKLAVVTILSILSALGIAVCSNKVMALEYSSNAGINFTISPSISVSISGDLVIDELVPGSSSDSNIVVVNVSTNNVSGYNLSSTVGNDTDTSSIGGSLIHNTTNLVHSSSVGSSSNVFTSLSVSDSLSTLTTPNTWGYSYSTDNSTTWSNYSGLPLYTDTSGTATLSEKYIPSNDNIDFKIAAYADDTQSSGEYTNKINFIAIAFPNPMSLAESYAYFNKTTYKGYYTMQDMSPGICATATDLSEMQVIDTRDDNVYTIAKLADHRCWMTANLNLEGGTQLSYEDTDIPEGYILPTANGFGENNTLPESSTEGFSNSAMAYLYNSHRNDSSYCSESPGCYSYYSWTTATVGSGLEITASNTDAPYSICMKNWHLPTTYDGTNSSTDFRFLAIILGGSNTVTNYNGQIGISMRETLAAPPYNFQLFGGYYSYNDFLEKTKTAIYWSSTVIDDYQSSFLYFTDQSNNPRVNFVGYQARMLGGFVRCIANN